MPPAVSDLIELVGIGVTGWFTYRYVTVGPDRCAPPGSSRQRAARSAQQQQPQQQAGAASCRLVPLGSRPQLLCRQRATLWLRH